MKKLSILLCLAVVLFSNLVFAGMFMQGQFGYSNASGYSDPNFLKASSLNGATAGFLLGYSFKSNFDLMVDFNMLSGNKDQSIISKNNENRQYSTKYSNYNVGLNLLRHQSIVENKFFLNIGAGFGIMANNINYSSHWYENDANGNPITHCIGVNHDYCVNSVKDNSKTENNVQPYISALVGFEYKVANNVGITLNDKYSYGLSNYNSSHISNNTLALGAKVYF
ncbi:hypothetical protein ACFX5K_01375 [Rickettsiales bacterium LUAb2]